MLLADFNKSGIFGEMLSWGEKTRPLTIPRKEDVFEISDNYDTQFIYLLQCIDVVTFVVPLNL